MNYCRETGQNISKTPDIASSDYNLFLSIAHGLANQEFTSLGKVTKLDRFVDRNGFSDPDGNGILTF